MCGAYNLFPLFLIQLLFSLPFLKEPGEAAGNPPGEWGLFSSPIGAAGGLVKTTGGSDSGTATVGYPRTSGCPTGADGAVGGLAEAAGG